MKKNFCDFSIYRDLNYFNYQDGFSFSGFYYNSDQKIFLEKILLFFSLPVEYYFVFSFFKNPIFYLYHFQEQKNEYLSLYQKKFNFKGSGFLELKFPGAGFCLNENSLIVFDIYDNNKDYDKEFIEALITGEFGAFDPKIFIAGRYKK